MNAATLTRIIEVADDYDAIQRLFEERQWGDGLPVVPPTEARVAAMLEGCGRPRDAVVASVAPAFADATVELLAVNAVLAGCKPGALPWLIAATEAVADPVFNLQAVQATTNPVAVWIVVNGPGAVTAGYNGGLNCLGEGNPANVTLGRAPTRCMCRASAIRGRSQGLSWPRAG